MNTGTLLPDSTRRRHLIFANCGCKSKYGKMKVSQRPIFDAGLSIC